MWEHVWVLVLGSLRDVSLGEMMLVTERGPSPAVANLMVGVMGRVCDGCVGW